MNFNKAHNPSTQTELLGWAHFCGAWDAAVGLDSGSDMEWGLTMVWVPREGALPPSSIT